MNEIAKQIESAIKLSRRRAKPPLTEKVTSLLAFLRDAEDGRTQPIIADAIEEDGLPVSAEDLERLRTATTKLHLHETKDGYAFYPDPPLKLRDIRRINRENNGHYFSPETIRFWGSRPHSKVHQGPGGTFIVDEKDNHDRTARLFAVRHFDPKTGGVNASFDGGFTWLPGDLGSSEEAHALAAHLAQHGRLPEPQQ